MFFGQNLKQSLGVRHSPVLVAVHHTQVSAEVSEAFPPKAEIFPVQVVAGIQPQLLFAGWKQAFEKRPVGFLTVRDDHPGPPDESSYFWAV